MDKLAAKRLLKLRDQHLDRRPGSEAMVTSFVTAILHDAGLLFDSLIPQTLCQPRGRRTGASEYDFVSTHNKWTAVALELKPAYCGKSGLRDALAQVREYAVADRDFKKGLIVATNGYSYVYRAIFCPSRSRELEPTSEAHLTEGILDTASSLVAFVKEVLSPTESLVDRKLATQFGAIHLIRNTRSSCDGSAKAVWREILDEIKIVKGWATRKPTETAALLRGLEHQLKRHGHFRDVPAARALLCVLRKSEHRIAIAKNILEEFDEGFPVDAALRHAIGELKEAVPGK